MKRHCAPYAPRALRFWIMLVHDRPVRSISFCTTAALPGNTGQLLSLEARAWHPDLHHRMRPDVDRSHRSAQDMAWICRRSCLSDEQLPPVNGAHENAITHCIQYYCAF
ncbi:hypothetical protein D917_07056 [Trichinella nativa]|uniref:Uncharacterized protein n=1 Tax=Trichinella nativa TaxID=6335 RepID=A0A1Y3ERA2_9BILA|nr:hypothetical protein D917_07056 [Trichinella nativa]